MMDKELDLKEKGRPIWIHESIEEDLKRVYDHFRDVYNRNEFLENEINRVKSETYKDEELTKMKEKYEKMKKAYFLGFPISEEEDKKIKEWIEKRPKCNEGAVGGRYTYKFTPTSIGVIGTIIDGMTGEKFTFQELS